MEDWNISETSNHEDYSNIFGMSNPTDYEIYDFYGLFKSLYNAYAFIEILSIVCYSITFILGVPGNGLVIWVAIFKMKTVSSVWFLNLAIADLICNLALILRIVQWAMIFEDDFDLNLCEIGMIVITINMFSSVYFLTVISIDRCVSIMWPFWSRIYRTRRVASMVAALTWLLCVLSSIPHVIHNFTHEESSDCFPRYDAWLVMEEDNRKVDKMLIIRNICMFSFPFIVIIISYVLIVHKVKSVKRSKNPQKHLRVIVAVVLCFFVCWFPYNTWPLVTAFYQTKHWKANMIISETCVCLAYFNSCVNPIVYVFFSQDFKRGFIQSLPARLETLFSDRPDVNTDETSVYKTNVELTHMD